MGLKHWCILNYCTFIPLSCIKLFVCRIYSQPNISLTIRVGPGMESGASDNSWIDFPSCGIIHVLKPLFQGIITLHTGIAPICPLLLRHPALEQCPLAAMAGTAEGEMQRRQGGNGMGTLLLEEDHDRWGGRSNILRPFGSRVSHCRVPPAKSQSSLSRTAHLRCPTENIKLILQEEARAVGQQPVHNGTEATHAAILVFTGGIRNVHPDICSFDIHITGTDTAAVKIAILEDVQDGV